MAAPFRAKNQVPPTRRHQAIARGLTMFGLAGILALQSAGPAWASVLGPTPSSIAPGLPERPRVLFGGENRNESIASLELPLVTPEDLASGSVEDRSVAPTRAPTLEKIQLARQGLQFIAAFMRSHP